MASPLASALDGARALYRRLPMSLRLPAGRAMRAVLEPALAARLPKATPGHNTPRDSAPLLGLFNAPLGHGAAAKLCALELRKAGVAVAEIDVTASVGAPQADRAFRQALAMQGMARANAVLGGGAAAQALRAP